MSPRAAGGEGKPATERDPVPELQPRTSSRPGAHLPLAPSAKEDAAHPESQRLTGPAAQESPVHPLRSHRLPPTVFLCAGAGDHGSKPTKSPAPSAAVPLGTFTEPKAAQPWRGVDGERCTTRELRVRFYWVGFGRAPAWDTASQGALRGGSEEEKEPQEMWGAVQQGPGAGT